jgi:plastocyanin
MAIDTKAPAVERARWTRLAVFGFLLAALGEFLMVVAIFAFGLDPEGEAGFFAVMMAIALVAALLVWRFGAWTNALGIVAGLLSAMALFWTAFGLMSPQSFFDFVPGVVVLPGALLAVGSCIAALVAGRRGHRTVRAEGGERSTMRVAIAVVAVAAVVSGGMTFLGKSTADVGSADATVAMSNFEFDSQSFRFDPGARVLVRNDDPFMHDFTVDALDIAVKTSPGDQVLVQMPDEAGTYVLYCTLHADGEAGVEDDEMEANLRIG